MRSGNGLAEMVAMDGNECKTSENSECELSSLQSLFFQD